MIGAGPACAETQFADSSEAVERREAFGEVNGRSMESRLYCRFSFIHFYPMSIVSWTDRIEANLTDRLRSVGCSTCLQVDRRRSLLAKPHIKAILSMPV